MSRNEELFARAQRIIPAGVNSPVRAFRSVGGTPRFFARGAGRLRVGRRRHALHRLRRLVGAGDPRPRASGRRRAPCRRRPCTALSFGAPTEARDRDGRDAGAAPAVDRDGAARVVAAPRRRCRRCASRAGTPAASKIIKFEGCYHGHGDSLLVKAGSGALTFGQPSSAGVPPAIASETIVAALQRPRGGRARCSRRDRRCDRRDHRRAGRRQHEPRAAEAPGSSRACARCAPPRRGADLRRGDDRASASHPAARRACIGITPDLTTLGKVIGGGMPVGAFGGRRAIMEKIAPLGPVYQAGTLSGNPVAVAAGLATLAATEAPGFYDALAASTRALTDGLAAAAKRAGVPFSAQSVGGMFGIYFAPAVPDSYDAVMACDKERFNRFFHAMLDGGRLPRAVGLRGGLRVGGASADDIAATIGAAERAFAVLAEARRWPELPDVDVYLEALARASSAQRSSAVALAQPVRAAHGGPAARRARGTRRPDVRRLGKRIVIAFDGELFLVVHLMIAGRLHWLARARKPRRRASRSRAFDFATGRSCFTEAGTKRRASLHFVRGEAALAALDPGRARGARRDARRVRAALRAREPHAQARAHRSACSSAASATRTRTRSCTARGCRRSTLTRSSTPRTSRAAARRARATCSPSGRTRLRARGRRRRFPRRSRRSGRRWRCTAASGSRARSAARRCSASSTPRTSATTARAARPAARLLADRSLSRPAPQELSAHARRCLTGACRVAARANVAAVRGCRRRRTTNRTQLIAVTPCLTKLSSLRRPGAVL